MRAALALLAALMAAPLFAQQSRIASDFEIARMRQQLAASHDFLSQLSGHLNLGDLYATRSETATARAEYRSASRMAGDERLAARRASDITRYATATSYAALAEAKLGEDGQAFALLEEAMRYSAGSAKSWNLYASAMSVLGRRDKGIGAARNAVAIATREAAASPTTANRLDLAVYRYQLASLVDAAEGEQLLREVIASLRASGFAPLRRDIARREEFEIYSSARGDASAYLSVLNRAELRLGSILEKRGDVAAARAEYQRVLDDRSDDPTALEALARLAGSPAERERMFAAAFEANPFSPTLLAAYRRSVDAQDARAADDSTTGGQVRAAVADIAGGNLRAARARLDKLLQRFPENETLKALRLEAEGNDAAPAFLQGAATEVTATPEQLRALLDLLANDRVTPEQRSALDRLTFLSLVTFEPAAETAPPGQSVFESGTIGEVRVRFSQPTAFAGTFSAGTPLRLTYRVLGATESSGADALLLEPVRLEVAR